MNISNFFNINAGWWAALALPIAIAALINGIVQVKISVQSMWMDGSQRRSALLTALNRAIAPASEHEINLVTGKFLPLYIVRHDGQQRANALTQVYERLREGKSVRILGPGGAGKTTIVQELRKHSVLLASRGEMGPIIDVVHGQEWLSAPHVFSTHADHFARWASKTLSRRYQTFGASYFRTLMYTGQLALAVDGLDEIPPREAKRLTRAMFNYSKKLPIAIFARPQSWDSPVGLYYEQFDTFESLRLAPMEWNVVLSILREVKNRPNTDTARINGVRARRLLTNPLRLRLLLSERITNRDFEAILTSDDPERTLWKVFLDRTLNDSIAAQEILHLARYAQAFALATEGAGGPIYPWDVPTDTEAIRITSWACLLILGVIGWFRGQDAVSLVTCLGIIYALREYTGGGFIDRLRIVLHIPDTAQSIYFIAAFSVIWQLLYSTFSIVRSGTLPRSFSEVNTWLVNVVPEIIRQSVNVQEAIAVGLFTAGIAIGTVLTSTRTDLINYYTRWIWPLKDRTRLSFTMRVLLVGFIPLNFYVGGNLLFIIGATCLATVVYKLLSAATLMRYLDSSHITLSRAVGVLESLELTYKRERGFRFIHDDLALALSQRALSEYRESAVLDIRRMVLPGTLETVLDARLPSNTNDWAGPALAHALRQDRSNSSLVVMQAMHMCYAQGNLAAAKLLLMDHIRRWGHDYLYVQLGEVLWFLDERSEAASRIYTAVRKFPYDFFVLNRSIRWMSSNDHQSEAEQLLRNALPRLKGDERVMSQVLLSEIQLRFGTSRDKESALNRLDVISKSTYSLPRERAILELARIAFEVDGNTMRALQYLADITPSEESYPVVSARLAQIYHSTNNDDQAKEYARDAFNRCEWSDDPRFQLETLITAAALLDNERAARESCRLISYGWSLHQRTLELSQWEARIRPS